MLSKNRFIKKVQNGFKCLFWSGRTPKAGNGFQMVLAKAEKRNGLYFAAESHSALNTHKYLSPFQVVKFTYMFEAFFDTKKVTIFIMSSFIFVKWLDYYTIFPFRMDD